MKIAPSKPEFSVDELSIVMVGTFNPTIFQPMWFASQDLLRTSEAENAKIEIIHQDVSIFSVEWLSIQVTRDRFVARTKADAYQSHLCDLVQGVLTCLSHTPVHQLGMNATFRIKFRNESDWHAFGHHLLPKSPWVDVLSKPGMTAAHVRGVRTDDRAGYLQMIVEPDLGTRTDALFRVNDHYELTIGKTENAGEFASLLGSNHSKSMDTAKRAADRVVANFLTVGEVDSGAQT